MARVPNSNYRDVLNHSEMQENAKWLYQNMSARGYSLNAIAAMLGNWESECTLNPNRPEYSGFPSNTSGGFGFAQWTPWGNKIGWYGNQQGVSAVASDSNPLADADFQLDYHDYECTYGLQGDTSKKTWYNNHGYNYAWSAFKTAKDDVEYMAAAYYWQYERSAAESVGSRGTQAKYWYNYLREIPVISTKKNNFIIVAYGSGLFK